MSRFTDELRNLDGMRDADELLPAAAVIIDEMEKALRAYDEFHTRIFCTGLPLEQRGKRIDHTDLNKAHSASYSALAMLEELSK